MNPTSHDGDATAKTNPGGPNGASAATPPSSSTPEQLRNALTTQGRQYEQLLVLLETLQSGEETSGSRTQALLNAIQHQLGQLQQTGDTCRRLRGQLSDESARKSPELAQELQRQEQLLERCLSRIQTLEIQFLDQRARLQPQLDETLRRRSMRTAYQQSLKTG